MLRVRDAVPDDLRAATMGSVRRSGGRAGRRVTHVLEEDLQDTTGLLVDEARDTLHTTTTCETADGGLGDTCEERG